MYVTTTANIDYPAVFFLLLSLWLLPKHRVLAFVTLGLSLGFKQLDVILVPLFLIVVWQSERQHRIRAVLIAMRRAGEHIGDCLGAFPGRQPRGFSQVDGV